jgi:hypothetical protein
MVQGFIDDISTDFVAGWMRDAVHPNLRVRFDVTVTDGDGTRVIAQAVADEFCQSVHDYGWADAYYGFRVEFPAPITTEERDSLEIIPSHSPTPLKRAPKFQGYVDERSTRHIRGWLRNRFAPEDRVEYEVVLESPEGNRTLASGIADLYAPGLEGKSIGDARYGFNVRFEPPLSEAERDALIVRPALGSTSLALSPRLVTVFEPA